MKLHRLVALAFLLPLSASAQDSLTLRHISDEVLLHGTCYENLRVLCKQVGNRLSATPQADKAVAWGEKAMKAAGADRVWLQPVEVPKWVRGKESLQLDMGDGKGFKTVPMLSLGNSKGTDGKPMTAPIIMVQSFKELDALSPKEVAGKIVFLNYHFRQELVSTFEGYGDAGPYRFRGPNSVSAKGAAGVIIRSISTGVDDVPHTGSMRYSDTVTQIPAVAIGNASADALEQAVKKGIVKARLTSECKMMGTVRSFNVIGEIKGSEHPEEIIVVGGHLDSWDVGEGAHDDGSGCVQSIEVIRTLKALGMRPKRTIRAVLFMNEENGARGGAAYADSAKAKGEKTIFALESDAGGFSPRGFGLDTKNEAAKAQIKSFAPLFLPYGVYNFDVEEGGTDIWFLGATGTVLSGLVPDPQRYFDLHHTDKDVFEAVNHRELKLGAAVMTGMVWLVSEKGLTRTYGK